MKPETEYKLKNNIPFLVLAVLFVVACITSDYYFKNGSDIGQFAVWGLFAAICIGFLGIITFKNR